MSRGQDPWSDDQAEDVTWGDVWAVLRVTVRDGLTELVERLRRWWRPR